MLRRASLTDALWLLGLSLGLSYCLFDEEPVFDFSDWSLLHVLLLLGATAVVINENILRSQAGQYVYKDQAALVAALNFWFGCENYFRLILVVFSVLCLAPLEADLFETVVVFHSVSAWATWEIGPCMLIVFLHAWLLRLLTFAVSSQRSALLLTALAVLAATAALDLSWLTWDLALSGLSAVRGTSHPEVFYLQPNSALAYDGQWGNQDPFEWHRAAYEGANARFEGLMQMLLQLSCMQSLAAYTGWLLLLLLNLLQQGAGALSYTCLSVTHAWFTHVSVAFATCLSAQVYTGLRIFLREPFEFWWLAPL